MKYWAAAHELLGKRDAGDLKLLWLLLLDPVGADQLLIHFSAASTSDLLEGDAIPTGFSCDLTHPQLPKCTRGVFLVTFQFLCSLCSWEGLWSVKTRCCALLWELIPVLRTDRKKRMVLNTFFQFALLPSLCMLMGTLDALIDTMNIRGISV